jgi:DNA-3-methyladenine glycosylase I
VPPCGYGTTQGDVPPPAFRGPWSPLRRGRLRVGVVPLKATGRRCEWAESSEAMRRYHDEEWGVPSHDDLHLFEMLVLEGAQAGLSWSTILNKRENYRKAFDGFDPGRISRYDEDKLDELLADPGIVRNRLKVKGAVTNARAFLATGDACGSFASYLWEWVDGIRIVNRPRSTAELPARTDLSDRMSKDLKRRGFTFVGSTIVYSFLQSVGVVDDHLVTCPAKR